MRATQDNASWISNTYEQGTSESNWAKAGVRYRVPRKQQVILNATTTSVEIDAPDGGYGATKELTVSNSTDGDTAVTATVTNNPFSAPSSFSWTSAGSTNYWDSSNSGITSNTQLRSALMTPDGTTLYRKYYTGATWYKFTLGTNYQPQAGANTYVSNFNLNSTVGTRLTISALGGQKITYAAGGNYAFMFGYGYNVARLTLGTPYLLETVTSTTVWDIENTITGYSTSYAGSDDNLMFTNIKISSDGTKGIYGIRLSGTTTGDSAIPNLQYGSFTLSTPFDLSTMTINATSNLGQGNNANAYSPFCEISENGEYVYTQGGEYNGSSFYLRIRSLNTAWDVSSYNNLLNQYTSSSNFYNGSMMYSRDSNGSFVIDNTNNKAVAYLQGNDFYVENAWTGRWYPTTTLDITSASLTAAPTSVIEDNAETVDVSYLQLTRSDAAKENVALAISKNSTATSLKIFPDMNYQGTGELDGVDLVIDGTSFTVSTTTFVNDECTGVGTNSTASPRAAKGTDLEQNITYLGAHQLLNPTTYGSWTGSSWNAPLGMAFDHTGTRFWVSGFTDNFGGNTLIDKPIVEFALSTAWDMGTATFVQAHNGDNAFRGAASDPTVNYQVQSFQFNYDGTKMYVLHSYSSGGLSYLYEGNLSTAYDVSTWSYNHHVEVGLLFSDTSPYVYDFHISPDGRALKFYKSGTTGALSSSTYSDSELCELTTPWDLQSVIYKRIHSASNDYRGSITGDETNGYITYATSFAADQEYVTLTVGTISGDLNQVTSVDDEVALQTYAEGWSTTYPVGSDKMAGKTLVVDNGTKLFMHIPESHQVLSFTGPFGNFKDRHEIDITSMGLSGQPKDVRFATDTSYTAMSSASLTTTANLYKEYTVPDVSLNAEALRFKIEGNTDAEVSRFNVDLFT